MKLYPSFDHEKLVFVGAGIFPWLTRDYWILGENLEGRLLRLGKRKVLKLSRDNLEFSYKNGVLKVMGRKVIASQTLILQLVRWLEDWKKNV